MEETMDALYSFTSFDDYYEELTSGIGSYEICSDIFLDDIEELFPSYANKYPIVKEKHSVYSRIDLLHLRIRDYMIGGFFDSIIRKPYAFLGDRLAHEGLDDAERELFFFELEIHGKFADINGQLCDMWLSKHRYGSLRKSYRYLYYYKNLMVKYLLFDYFNLSDTRKVQQVLVIKKAKSIGYYDFPLNRLTGNSVPVQRMFGLGWETVSYMTTRMCSLGLLFYFFGYPTLWITVGQLMGRDNEIPIFYTNFDSINNNIVDLIS